MMDYLTQVSQAPLSVSVTESRSWSARFALYPLAFVLGLTCVISISAGYIAWALLLLGMAAVMWSEGLPGIQWRSLPFLSLFAAYVSWGLISGFFGAGLGRSLYYWRSDLLCVFLWTIFILFQHYPGSRKALWKGFWLGIAFLAAAGVAQFFIVRHWGGFNEWLMDASFKWIRRFAVQPHHNFRSHGHLHILTYAEIVSIAGIYVLGQAWKRGWLKAAVAMLCFAAVLASMSRGAIVAYAAGLVFFFAGSFYHHKRFHWKAVLPSIIIGMIALNSSMLKERIHSIVRPEDNQDRLIMWKVGWRMLQDNPVTGVGIGHVKTRWNQYCEEEWKKYVHEREVWSDVHSVYIQQAGERGLPGLVLVVVLLAGFPLAIAARIRRLDECSKELEPAKYQAKREFLLASCAVMIAFLIMNVTESTFQDTEVVFVVYLILAAALASDPPALSFQNGRKAGISR